MYFGLFVPPTGKCSYDTCSSNISLVLKLLFASLNSSTFRALDTQVYKQKGFKERPVNLKPRLACTSCNACQKQIIIQPI